jgi:hypothetical protein
MMSLEDRRSYEAWHWPHLNEDSEDFNCQIGNPNNSMIKVLLCIDCADQAVARNSKRSQNNFADEKPWKKAVAARAVSFSPNFDYYSKDFDGDSIRLATNKQSLTESILAEDEPLLLDKKEKKNGIASVHHLPSKVFEPNKWYLEWPYPGTQEDPSVEEAVEKSKLASHVPPVNWYGKSKYNSDVVEIFTAWIKVDETLHQMKDRAFNRLFVNPPVLPWYLPEGTDFIALVMNYVTLHESNEYSNGGNSANYVQCNGHLTVACWGLPHVLLGDDTFFTSLRCNFWPFVYNHKRQDGKPEDIFALEDLAVIMKVQAKFIQKVIEKSKKTHLMSSAVCDNARFYLGHKTVDDLFLKDKLFSLSRTKYETCCHPECLLNVTYKGNPHALMHAQGWDAMYSIIKSFVGDENPCTSGVGSLNFVPGSKEHLLSLEKEQVRIENLRESSIESFKDGINPLQLNMKMMLEELGYENVDPLKVMSQTFKDDINPLQLNTKMRLEELGYKNVDPLKAMSIHAIESFKDGINPLQLNAKMRLEELGYKNVDPLKAMSQTFKDGINPVQLNAKMRLEELGYKNVDPLKAMSIHAIESFKDGINTLQLNVKMRLEELSYKNVDPLKAMSIHAIESFKDGVNPLQLNAKMRLEELGYKNVDPLKAMSIHAIESFKNGINPLQVNAKMRLEELGYKNVDPLKAMSIHAIESFKDGINPLQLNAKMRLEELGYKNVDPCKAQSTYTCITNLTDNPRNRYKDKGGIDPQKKTWTEDQVELLRKLCAKKYSMRKIAENIEGHSRRTVHIKIFELKLEYYQGKGVGWIKLTGPFK